MTHHCKGRQRGSQGLQTLSRPGRAHHPPCSHPQAWQFRIPKAWHGGRCRTGVSQMVTDCQGGHLSCHPSTEEVLPPGCLSYPILKSAGRTTEEEDRDPQADSQRLLQPCSDSQGRSRTNSRSPAPASPGNFPGPSQKRSEGPSLSAGSSPSSRALVGGCLPRRPTWLLEALPLSLSSLQTTGFGHLPHHLCAHLPRYALRHLRPGHNQRFTIAPMLPGKVQTDTAK